MRIYGRVSLHFRGTAMAAAASVGTAETVIRTLTARPAHNAVGLAAEGRPSQISTNAADGLVVPDRSEANLAVDATIHPMREASAIVRPIIV